MSCGRQRRLAHSARGTRDHLYYGVDGVCHQLANQVLFATGIGGAKPLTCNGARGYMASTFIYGTYGLAHAAWAHEIASCGAAPNVALAGGGATVSGLPDDFEARARKVLENEDPKLLSDLLALRADTQRFAAPQWPGAAAPSADALNARNQHLIDEAARLLGPDRFKQIFGFSPQEIIQLVDPRIQHPQPGFK